jgi:hypothetical protein
MNTIHNANTTYTIFNKCLTGRNDLAATPTQHTPSITSGRVQALALYAELTYTGETTPGRA